MRKKTFHYWLAPLLLLTYLASATPVPLTIPYTSSYKAPARVSEECVGNEAGEYPCSEVDLKGFFSASNMVGSTTKKLSE